ncbi:MAG: helix-turn-helix transcriptional regulator [Flavobacteriales bacterium]|nr:helix-turn-helix transcriptional regulator [Flavobacteriales bacterium]
MLNIGERITQLRKQANLSQTELAKKVAVSRTIVGNYERNENAPSVEILLKIANVLDVSIDFLIGQGEIAKYDKDMLKRIEDIANLSQEDQNGILYALDNLIKAAKIKAI